jgi:hypothetical protein
VFPIPLLAQQAAYYPAGDDGEEDREESCQKHSPQRYKAANYPSLSVFFPSLLARFFFR